MYPTKQITNNETRKTKITTISPRSLTNPNYLASFFSRRGHQLWNTPVVLHSCGAGGLIVVKVGEPVLGGLDGSVLGSGNCGQVVDRCRSICLKGVNSFKQSVVGASATLAR